jgi:8-oxo-dGTP pyrophosphatase MutT (NUDIX family)
MEYIQRMRKLVGHAPLLLVGAAVLVMREGRLLMMRRTDNHAWGIPGGSLEPGEKLEDAARRETWEEAGLELGDLKLFDVFSGPELYYCYPNGDEVYNVSVVFLAEEMKGEIHLNPEEHSEYCFFDLGALPEEVSPPIRVVLVQLKASLLNCV